MAEQDPAPIRRGLLLEWPAVVTDDPQLHYKARSVVLARATSRVPILLEEGLRWIGAGYTVQLLMRCIDDGKHPYDEAWHLRGINSESAFRAAVKERPWSNLAVITGPGTGPDGSWLVTCEADADKADPWGPSRADAFAQHADFLGPMPSTPALESRRGPKILATIPTEFGAAFHELLSSPTYDSHPRVELHLGGYKRKGGELVRKASSYICAPSECGRVERVTTDPTLVAAMLPDELLDRLARIGGELHAADVAERLERAARRAERGFDLDDLDDDEEASWRAYRDARIEEDFEKKVGPAIEGHGGSNATFHAACLVIEAGVEDEDEQLELLERYNDLYADPPWDEEGLLHKLEGARAAVGSKRAMEDRLREAWARGYARKFDSASGRFSGSW
ncbi:hypothetical protein [Paludisphaera soli]|uniref:hypothetical protein n=1 Tax=Paludisphaera soli TaxID=2712865 RepID=UPI0013ED129F|nr:hypothetical protein [Paludisphaera soli]